MNTTLYVVPDSVVPSITKGEMMSGPISDVAIGEFYFSSAFGLGMLLSGRGGEPVMVGDEYDTIIISGPDLLPNSLPCPTLDSANGFSRTSLQIQWQ